MPTRNPIREDEFPARVWPKIDATGDCWEWTGGHNPKGYGRLASEGPAGRMVHRNVWHVLVGPIVDGLTIDHRCRNRGCANPDHFELVASGVNVLRGYGPPARNARKVVCGRGHELPPPGDDGERRCEQCGRDQQRAWLAAHPDYVKDWRAAHPEQRRADRRAWKARDRARKRAARLDPAARSENGSDLGGD